MEADYETILICLLFTLLAKDEIVIDVSLDDEGLEVIDDVELNDLCEPFQTSFLF